MRLTETLSKLSLMYFLHIAQNDEYPDLDINYGKTILAKSQYTGELDLNDLCSEIISELRKSVPDWNSVSMCQANSLDSITSGFALSTVGVHCSYINCTYIAANIYLKG